MIENKEQLDKAYKKALIESLGTDKDRVMIDLRLDEDMHCYGVFITTWNTDINILFNTANFKRDFNNALREATKLMDNGDYEKKGHPMSYNSFSYGIFLSSNFDDYMSKEDNPLAIIRDAGGEIAGVE